MSLSQKIQQILLVAALAGSAIPVSGCKDSTQPPAPNPQVTVVGDQSYELFAQAVFEFNEQYENGLEMGLEGYRAFKPLEHFSFGGVSSQISDMRYDVESGQVVYGMRNGSEMRRDAPMREVPSDFDNRPDMYVSFPPLEGSYPVDVNAEGEMRQLEEHSIVRVNLGRRAMRSLQEMVNSGGNVQLILGNESIPKEQWNVYAFNQWDSIPYEEVEVIAAGQSLGFSILVSHPQFEDAYEFGGDLSNR